MSVGRQATAQNQFSGSFSYFYDADGNMIQNGGAHYTYDAEDRLMSAGGVNYTYDGDGNRVMKSSGTIYWGGGESGALAETDLSGNIQQEYIFFNGKRQARVDLSDDTMHFYFADHLGSTSDVTDAVGNIQYESDYYPYGGEMPVITGDSNHYKFSGKERDAETGLDEFPKRYYGSALGRWMTPDPLPWLGWQHPSANASEEEAEEAHKKFEDWIGNPQNLNMYAYVNNNPLRYTDPTGMAGCQAGDKKFSTCTITITYDKKTHEGTLVVTGQNKGDKSPTTLLTSSVVVGGDGHVTPTGTFTATSWSKDHTSTVEGRWSETPYSKTWFGTNAFGPYQLHMKELDSRGIYIHGTMGPNNSPFTFGNDLFGTASHGCIRMCNRDDNAPAYLDAQSLWEQGHHQGSLDMTRKAWIVFVVVQLFGELGPWAGVRIKSSLGPALWVAGMVVMMPGRLLALFITEKLLWNVGLTPHLMTALFVLIEVPANLLVWLLCARLFRSLHKRHVGKAMSQTTSL